MPADQPTPMLGLIVMLVRGLHPANGHVNGACYILKSSTITVQFLRSGFESGDTNRFILPCVPCNFSDGNILIP